MMMDLSFTSLLPVFPEVFLAVGSIAILIVCILCHERKPDARMETAYRGTALLLITTLLLSFLVWPKAGISIFGGAFVADGFIFSAKMLILLLSLTIVLLSADFFHSDSSGSFEFYTLISLATLGAMMMVSAGDLIALYMAMEIQALSSYVLVSMRRDSLYATEAGLKYFILGSLSSGMMLYGFSLIYGFTGTVDLASIGYVARHNDVFIGLILGLVFFLAGMAFKLSVVPFHMWTPDVYEGAPAPVAAFLATVMKVGAVIVLVRMTSLVFTLSMAQWRPILVFLSVCSMVWGAFAAIGQRSLKRLMAYSSISHMGVLLLGLAVGTQASVNAAILYLLVYSVTTLGVFACIFCMHRGASRTDDISSLSGISKAEPTFALFFSVLLFSLAGLPPLAGFLGKFYIFLYTIGAGMYPVAILGVVSSVIGSFYYLRIIKIMYFDELGSNSNTIEFSYKFVFVFSGLFALFSFVFLGTMLDCIDSIITPIFQ